MSKNNKFLITSIFLSMMFFCISVGAMKNNIEEEKQENLNKIESSSKKEKVYKEDEKIEDEKKYKSNKILFNPSRHKKKYKDEINSNILENKIEDEKNSSILENKIEDEKNSSILENKIEDENKPKTSKALFMDNRSEIIDEYRYIYNDVYDTIIEDEKREDKIRNEKKIEKLKNWGYGETKKAQEETKKWIKSWKFNTHFVQKKMESGEFKNVKECIKKLIEKEIEKIEKIKSKDIIKDKDKNIKFVKKIKQSLEKIKKEDKKILENGFLNILEDDVEYSELEYLNILKKEINKVIDYEEVDYFREIIKFLYLSLKEGKLDKDVDEVIRILDGILKIEFNINMFKEFLDKKNLKNSCNKDISNHNSESDENKVYSKKSFDMLEQLYENIKFVKKVKQSLEKIKKEDKKILKNDFSDILEDDAEYSKLRYLNTLKKEIEKVIDYEEGDYFEKIIKFLNSSLKEENLDKDIDELIKIVDGILKIKFNVNMFKEFLDKKNKLIEKIEHIEKNLKNLYNKDIFNHISEFDGYEFYGKKNFDILEQEYKNKQFIERVKQSLEKIKKEDKKILEKDFLNILRKEINKEIDYEEGDYFEKIINSLYLPLKEGDLDKNIDEVIKRVGGFLKLNFSINMFKEFLEKLKKEIDESIKKEEMNKEIGYEEGDYFKEIKRFIYLSLKGGILDKDLDEVIKTLDGLSEFNFNINIFKKFLDKKNKLIEKAEHIEKNLKNGYSRDIFNNSENYEYEVYNKKAFDIVEQDYKNMQFIDKVKQSLEKIKKEDKKRLENDFLNILKNDVEYSKLGYLEILKQEIEKVIDYKEGDYFKKIIKFLYLSLKEGILDKNIDEFIKTLDNLSEFNFNINIFKEFLDEKDKFIKKVECIEKNLKNIKSRYEVESSINIILAIIKNNVDNESYVNFKFYLFGMGDNKDEIMCPSSEKLKNVNDKYVNYVDLLISDYKLCFFEKLERLMKEEIAEIKDEDNIKNLFKEMKGKELTSNKLKEISDKVRKYIDEDSFKKLQYLFMIDEGQKKFNDLHINKLIYLSESCEYYFFRQLKKIIGKECEEKESIDKTKKILSKLKEILNKKILNKESLDKESLNKESLDKESLNKESLNKESLDKGSLNKESLNKEILNKKILNKESLNKESLNKESLNKESLDKGSLNKESLNKESLNKESLNKESLNKESLDKESLNKESLDKESLNKESLNKESLDKESLNKESLNKESLDKESLNKESLNKESLDKESLNKESLNKESLDKESLDKESLNKESLDKESLDKESLNKESLNKESLNKESLNKESLDKDDKNSEVLVKEYIKLLIDNLKNKLNSKMKSNQLEILFDVLPIDEKKAYIDEIMELLEKNDEKGFISELEYLIDKKWRTPNKEDFINEIKTILDEIEKCLKGSIKENKYDKFELLLEKLKCNGVQQKCIEKMSKLFYKSTDNENVYFIRRLLKLVTKTNVNFLANVSILIKSEHLIREIRKSQKLLLTYMSDGTLTQSNSEKLLRISKMYYILYFYPEIDTQYINIDDCVNRLNNLEVKYLKNDSGGYRLEYRIKQKSNDPNDIETE